MNTELPQDQQPAGFSTWNKNDTTPTAFYAEYNNTGPGNRPQDRAPWTHQLTPAQAKSFEPDNFLAGQDHWNPTTEAATLP